MIYQVIGFGLISLSATYWAWVVFRAARLRQDLYNIRCELYDGAAKAEGLSDPCCISTLLSIESLSTSAPKISIPFFGYLIMSTPPGALMLQRAKTEEVQNLIDDAIEKASTRILQYLFNETASGLFISLLFLIRISSSKVVRNWVQMSLKANPNCRIA